MESVPIIIFVIAVVLIVCLRVHKTNVGKKWKELGNLFGKMENIFKNARKGKINRINVDRFFDYADRASDMMLNEPFLNDMDDIPRLKNKLEKMSNQITLVAARSPKVSTGEEIDKLAALRKQGLISDMEFKAFSERFSLSTGDKASSIIKAISSLSEQRKQGAMMEGNYHAALWSLLDKLDRKT